MNPVRSTPEPEDTVDLSGLLALNLYLLTRTSGWDDDQARGFVIAAATKGKARAIAVIADNRPGDNTWESCPCTLFGVATQNTFEGVVLRDDSTEARRLSDD